MRQISGDVQLKPIQYEKELFIWFDAIYDSISGLCKL